MPTEQKIKTLKRKIRLYTQACQSDWPQMSDYTNLIDAQYDLRALSADDAQL